MYESNEHPVSSPFFQKPALLASAGGQKGRGAIRRCHASGARLPPAYRYAVDFSPEPAVCTRAQPTAAPGCPLACAGMAVTAGLYTFAEAGPAILLLSARHRVYAIRWNRKRAACTRCSFSVPTDGINAMSGREEKNCRPSFCKSVETGCNRHSGACKRTTGRGGWLCARANGRLRAEINRISVCWGQTRSGGMTAPNCAAPLLAAGGGEQRWFLKER